MIKVSKFGGSSVASAAQIKKVEAIVKSDSSRRFIVVSAPGKRSEKDTKVTDLLYEFNKTGDEEIFNEIKTRLHDIQKELGIKKPFEISEEEKARMLASPDYAASRGEHYSARIIAEYMGATFVETEGVLLIGPNDSIIDATYVNFRHVLSGPGIFVIPGFYGSNPKGEVETFSRGGSDITGAIVAKAVGADIYENWTDVSGMLLANPNFVPFAKTVPELTYRELRLLAQYGATVFHPDAVAPVENLIPINIRNTNRPDDPGTMITVSRDSTKSPLAGIACKGDTVVVIASNKIDKLFIGVKNPVDLIQQLYVSRVGKK